MIQCGCKFLCIWNYSSKRIISPTKGGKDNHVMYVLEFFAHVICSTVASSSLVSRLIDGWHVHVAASLDLRAF